MMMDISSALDAFQTAAGVAPDKLSHWLRTLILIFMLLWSGWEMLGFIHHLQAGGSESCHRGWFLFRVMVVLCLVWVMVFI